MSEMGSGVSRPGASPAGLDPRLLFGIIAAVVVACGLLLFAARSGGEAAGPQDDAAKVSARKALLAAKMYYTQHSSYGGVNAAELAALKPPLRFVDGPSTSASTVSMASDGHAVGFAVLSGSGTCFYAKDSPGAGETFGTGTTCTGAAALSGATADGF